MPWSDRPDCQREPDAELDPPDLAVDAALESWRRKASDILLLLVAAGHLPVIVLGTLGLGPPMGAFPKAVGLVVYVVVAAAAVCRRVHYRRRVWASLAVLSPALLIASLVAPDGPYAQIGVITTPIFALVLLGSRAGSIIAIASSAVILAVPLVREHPAVVHLLAIDPRHDAVSVGLVWFRAAVKAASLFTSTILLGRFHGFLSDTLRARIVAQRGVERELRERQRLEREVAGVGDQERRRLGQDLHDGVCQQVTAALLRSQALERRLAKGGVVALADVTPLSSLLADTMDDAHDIAKGLCPLDSHPEALAAALGAMARRTRELAGLACEFRVVGDASVYDPEVAQHVYRIAQEAVSNATRHAGPSRITIELCTDAAEVSLQVDDDGAGLPPDPGRDGMGLRTMSYRAQILGGRFTVASRPGGGTRVVARVPAGQPAVATGHLR